MPQPALAAATTPFLDAIASLSRDELRREEPLAWARLAAARLRERGRHPRRATA